MLWFLGHEACGILALWPRIEPTRPALEGNIPATRPPGKSLKSPSLAPSPFPSLHVPFACWFPSGLVYLQPHPCWSEKKKASPAIRRAWPGNSSAKLVSVGLVCLAATGRRAQALSPWRVACHGLVSVAFFSAWTHLRFKMELIWFIRN